MHHSSAGDRSPRPLWGRRGRGRAAYACLLFLVLALGGMVSPRRPAVAAAPTGDVRSTLSAGVVDSQGARVTAPSAARIVALDGDVAEIIWALGLGSHVVGTDLSATYPPAAARLHHIGYQRQLNAEVILALKPTIIIGTLDAGPPSAITQLRGSGVRVVIVNASDTMFSTSLPQAVASKIAAVASALGVAAAGQRLNATVAKQIAAAEALARTAKSKPRVAFLLVEAQANTYLIAGKGSSFSRLISAAGGVDAGGASGIMGYVPLTPEALVKARPDVLLVLKSGADSVGGIKGLLKLPGVSLTPAGQAKRILIYEDDFLGNMGPRTGQALMQLVYGLHPELKK